MKSAAVLIAALTAAAWAGPVFAVGGEDAAPAGTPATSLELSYGLYAGGISLGRMDMSARMQGDHYDAHSTMTTAGVVASFWRARLEGASFGAIETNRVQPERYDASSVYDGPRRELTMHYKAGLPAITAVDPPDPIPESQMRGTVDPISALMSFIVSSDAQAQKPCTQSEPVFDGKRRYDMSLSFERKSDVKMDSGLYAGQVEICRLHYKPVAGPDQNVIPDRALPAIYGWVGALRDKNTGRRYLLPLRVWANTPYGLAVALLTKITLDGTALEKIDAVP